jgi:uncharacterized protein YndB with AHSA1/START domain
MGKYKFVKEYEIKASVKMLYPYFSTASGLADWFAEKVKAIDPQTFEFHWDNEDHIGKIVAHRAGKSIKFEFVPEPSEDTKDASFIEFKLDFNEMTSTTFVKVTDYSLETDVEELHKLWDGLVHTLKETVGG